MEQRYIVGISVSGIIQVPGDKCAEMGEKMISIKDISKYYRVTKRDTAGMSAVLKSLFRREYHEVKAVEHIDLSVKKGEIRALIGPNGAGKSTVLKMLSGVLYPTSGEIQVMGYTPWQQREELVRKIGVVFGQKSQLQWDLPTIDTCQLNKIIYDIPEQVYHANLEYFIEHLNLKDVISKPVRQLSLGERMKCEFVCALLHQPPLLILDEPPSHRKILEFHFAEKVDKEQLMDYHVISCDRNSVKIELNRRKMDTQECIQKICGQFPVMDINIANISIEEVIRDIYQLG